MKISFECECILLQKSMMLFLGKFASRRKDCDFIISDKKLDTNKPVFIIGENSPYLKFPFNKQELVYTIEDFYSAMQIKHRENIEYISSSFEDKLNNLLNKFKIDLTELIKNELKK
ncbi:ornithine carbamoyltransferase [Campylobacter sp. RM12327]|uniref:ornithine carbamoyltransferase n=1 Tax=Campylobacter sputorum TaxID=206 RepID=UPI000B79AADA|nr:MULTISPECIES: ornithine carbamoyltransferase [Campylobacter]MBE7358499.1 ornithine carbamoyltransferase [Campylobacter sp. RM11302]MBF6669742.1 ornithine carbamoyltransferase [Campylobacter sp. RM12327]MBF6674970.1 ornithine carbamoyltransferase [Campylobacter sp. RM13538]MBF6676330.1 ornithine carbamoyltransferase [Campylobacter sp. RM12321]MBF6678075.1 ornithine carbamoyltransferase [Campylobacter sp. RM11259]